MRHKSDEGMVFCLKVERIRKWAAWAGSSRVLSFLVADGGA